MAIREDLVSSAIQFLQDPSVSSSSIENRISFLRSKNLTQEEIDVALSRVGAAPPPPSSVGPYQGVPSGPPAPYYQQFPQHAWQPPPPPRRDWRDWFIMATVVGGVSYGIYSLGKRYVMPLVAPPTPEKLEQDKKTIEDQFDRAFSLVEQLAKDTEGLKKAEEQRTERLDTALAELESVMSDLKSANRRREDDAQRIRDEVQSLKDAIPKALNNQKDLTDNRLREINGELTSLKTLVSQRMSHSAAAPTPAATPNPLRPSASSMGSSASIGKAATVNGGDKAAEPASVASPSSETPKPISATSTSQGRPGISKENQGSKASIPAWQMAFAKQSEGGPSSSSAAATSGAKTEAEAAAPTS